MAPHKKLTMTCIDAQCMKLVGVVDGDAVGREFFGMKVKPINAVKEMKYDCVVITSYLKRDEISRELMQYRGDRKAIREIFPLREGNNSSG